MISTTDIIVGIVGLAAPFVIGLWAYFKGKKSGQLQGSFEAGQDELKRHAPRITAIQIIEAKAATEAEILDDLRVEDAQLPTMEALEQLHGAVEAVRLRDGKAPGDTQ